MQNERKPKSVGYPVGVREEARIRGMKGRKGDEPKRLWAGESTSECEGGYKSTGGTLGRCTWG